MPGKAHSSKKQLEAVFSKCKFYWMYRQRYNGDDKRAFYLRKRRLVKQKDASALFVHLGRIGTNLQWRRDGNGREKQKDRWTERYRKSWIAWTNT